VRSFRRLVVLNAALLLAYTIADLFVWATVSTIPHVTEVFWSPIILHVALQSSGSSASMSGGYAGFTFFIAFIAVNLVFAHAGTRKYYLISTLMFGFYVLINDLQYDILVSLISPFQSNLTWNHIYIAIGNATIIIPNLTLFVALAATIANIMYVRRTANLPSGMLAEK
jgi:hypothetical protein